MMVEAVVGGAVLLFAAAGMYSISRRAWKGLTSWISGSQPDTPQGQSALREPTPYFTVELVRTVLEHQAQREDQNRQQLVQLFLKLAGMHSPEQFALHSRECENQDHYGSPGNSTNGMPGPMSRLFHRLLPRRKTAFGSH
jgi:hypothetical protein